MTKTLKSTLMNFISKTKFKSYQVFRRGLFSKYFFVIIAVVIVCNVVLADFFIRKSVLIVISSLICFDIVVGLIIWFLFKIPKENIWTAVLFSMIVLSVSFRCINIINIPALNFMDSAGKTIEITGTVISGSTKNMNKLENSKDILTGFETSMEKSRTGGLSFIRTEFGLISVPGISDKTNIGDFIKIKLKLEKPSSKRNPGGFDEEKYLRKKGIYVKGFSKSLHVIHKGKKNIFFNWCLKLRKSLLESFEKLFPQNESALLSAILTGEKSGLSNKINDELSKSGIAHIAAVSGTAVAFVFQPLKRLLNKLKASRKTKTLILYFFLITFGSIALWTPSASRAIVMIIIHQTGLLLNKKTNFLHSIALAITIILFVSPLYALNIGFWLSITAVAGIVFFGEYFSNFFEKKTKFPKIITDLLGVSIAVNLFVTPLQIYINSQISPQSVLSNLLILPVVRIIIPLGFILGFFGMIPIFIPILKILSLPVRGMLDWILIVSQFFSKFELFIIRGGRYPIFLLSGVVLIILVLIVQTKKNKILLIIFSILICITWLSSNFINKKFVYELETVFIDVGQGDSTFIRIKNEKTILIDAGDSPNGSRAVKDVLNYYSVLYPDIYIATHGHFDHIGGMIDLINERGGKILILPFGSIKSTNNEKSADSKPDLTSDLIVAAKEKNMEIIEVRRGDLIKLGENCNITFHNPKDDRGFYTDDLNNVSLVTKIDYKGFKTAIFGDATGLAEDDMIYENENLDSDIYRIAHHGSPQSTNNAIINKVNPLISIISVGYNKYGHPSPDVINRLLDFGSAIYRTDINGAVIIRYNLGKVYVKKMLE